MADGRIEIEITGDGSELQRVIEELQNQAESASDKTKEAAEKAAADAEKAANKSAESATKSISKSVSEATGNFSDMSGKASSVFSSLSSGTQKVGDALTKYITKPATAAAGALGTVVLAKGWSRMTEIDEAKVKLEAIGNTAEDVAEIMDNATASVKGTAYGLDEAATLSATAVAAGIEPGKELTEYLTAIGDTAAVAGTDLSEMGDIFNKITTRGKASMVNLSEFTIRGIDVYGYLGDTLGKTAEEIESMARRGEISMSDLQVAIEEHIGGAAKTIGSSTITGAIENIWASVGRIGANFLGSADDASSFAGQVLPLLNEFMDSLEDVEGWAADAGSVVGEVFGALVEYIRDGSTDTAAMSSSARDLFNACVPFVDLLKSIGSFWDSLSDSQKMALTATAVLAGPAVKALSKITSAASKVASGVSKASSTISDMFSKATEGAEEAEGSVGRFSNVAGIAKGALVGLGVAAAGALAAFVVSQVQEYQEHLEKVTEATDGLTHAQEDAKTSTEQVTEAAEDASEAASDYRDGLQDVIDAADECAESAADLAQSMKEDWEDYYTSEGVLEKYVSTIEDLSGKSSLTADEQEKLKTAVENYNDVTGDSVEVTDAVAGKLDKSTEKIKKNAEAWLDNAKQQAYQSQIGDLTEQLVQQEDEAEKLRQKIGETQTYIDDLRRDAEQNPIWSSVQGERTNVANQSEIANATNDLNTLNKSLQDVTGEMNASTGTMQRYYDEMSGEGESMQALISYSDTWSQTLADAQIPLTDFCDYLDGLGISVEDMTTATDEDLQTLAASYGDTMDQITGTLEDSGVSMKQFSKLSVDEIAQVADGFDGSAESIATSLDGCGSKAAEKLAGEIRDNTPEVESAAEDMGNAVPEGAESAVESSDSSGSFLSWASGILEAVKGFFGIASPSRAFAEVGEDCVEGYNQGLSGGDTSGAVSDMVHGALGALNGIESDFQSEGADAASSFIGPIQDSGGEAESAASSVSESAQFGFSPLPGDLGNIASSAVSGVISTIAGGSSGANSSATSVANSAYTGLSTLTSKAGQAGSAGAKSYSDKIGSANASPQGKSLANTAKSGMASVSANSTGQNFVQGFINGAQSLGGTLASVASSLANKALNAMKSALNIGSPSKVTKQYGKWFTQGFAIGITNADKDVTRATVKMVEKGLSALSGATLKATTKSASTYVATASISAMTEQTQALQKSVNDAFDKAFKKLKTYKGTDFSDYTKNVMDTFTSQLEKASKKSTKKVTNTVNNVVKKATKAAEKAAGKDTKLTKAYEKLGKKAINAYEKAATKEIEKATEKLEKKLTEIADAAQEAIDDVMARQEQLYDTLTDTISMFRTTSGGNVKLLDMDEQMEDMDHYMDLLEQIQKAGASTSVVAYITEQDLDTGTKLMEELLSLSDSEMKSYFSMYDKLYAQAAQVSEDFYADEVKAIQDKYTKQVKKAFNSLKKDMKDIGKNVASAFADGLTKNTKTATKAAKKMANQVVKAVKKELGIHSPSKVFAELAEMSVQGYTDEMSDSSKQVVRSVSEAFAKVATVSAPEIEVGFSVDTVSLKKMSEEATAMLGAVSTAAVVHNEAVLGSTVTSSIEEQTRELTDRCDELAGTLTEILEATKAERKIDIDHRGLARFVREV